MITRNSDLSKKQKLIAYALGIPLAGLAGWEIGKWAIDNAQKIKHTTALALRKAGYTAVRVSDTHVLLIANLSGFLAGQLLGQGLREVVYYTTTPNHNDHDD